MAYGLSYDICDGMKNTYRPCVLWGKTAKSWGSRPFPGTQMIYNHNKHGRQTIIVLRIDFLKVQIQLKSLVHYLSVYGGGSSGGVFAWGITPVVVNLVNWTITSIIAIFIAEVW